jgi:hypothetical protein
MTSSLGWGRDLENVERAVSGGSGPGWRRGVPTQMGSHFCARNGDGRRRGQRGDADGRKNHHGQSEHPRQTCRWGLAQNLGGRYCPRFQ